MLVTDPALAADADRCVALFRAAFPAATWTAIGLPCLPEDPAPWQRHGIAGAELVADLGIVACGRRARYQDVSTGPDHRGRGLASHLLGLAADWALALDCAELVIVTEAKNPAGRLYRRAGFTLSSGSVEAYRAS